MCECSGELNVCVCDALYKRKRLKEEGDYDPGGNTPSGGPGSVPEGPGYDISNSPDGPVGSGYYGPGEPGAPVSYGPDGGGYGSSGYGYPVPYGPGGYPPANYGPGGYPPASYGPVYGHPHYEQSYGPGDYRPICGTGGYGPDGIPGGSDGTFSDDFWVKLFGAASFAAFLFCWFDLGTWCRSRCDELWWSFLDSVCTDYDERRESARGNCAKIDPCRRRHC